MTESLGIPRHLRRPGEDGYRTPTIEDAESCLSNCTGQQTFRLQSLVGTHATALGTVNDPALQQVRSRGAENGETHTYGNYPGIDHGIPPKVEDEDCDKLSWKQRIRHLTWAYFTLTMATGGIANVLYNSKRASFLSIVSNSLNNTYSTVPNPYRFNGLETIGTVVFLINIFLYLSIWALLIMRFYFFPYTFRVSFLHPTESLFVPATVVSFGTILINISQYGPGKTGPWLVEAVQVLFWFDAALAVILSGSVYLLLYV
jgi:hypothetical protein